MRNRIKWRRNRLGWMNDNLNWLEAHGMEQVAAGEMESVNRTGNTKALGSADASTRVEWAQVH